MDLDGTLSIDPTEDEAMHLSPTTTTQSRDVHHLSELTHQIYDASVHPERWNGVVAAIAASFGSVKGLLFTPFLAPHHGGFIFPTGIGETALQLWANAYIDKDIWAQRIQEKGLLRTGAALLDQEVVPREEFLASPFYREFLSTIGIGRVCVGVVFEGMPGLPATVISIFRDAHEPAFDQTDAQWMKLLAAHASRSLGLMQHLDTARLHNASLLASNERLNFGVALLNDNMQVLHLNRAAQGVMDRCDGLFISENRQLESKPSSTQPRSLAHWLTTIKNTPRAAQGNFLEGYRVERSVDGQHYTVQCAEVLPTSMWAAQGETIRYIVFIMTPSALQLPSAIRLSTLYELTKAQAKVALEFSNGGSYRQVALRLRVSEDTVRSHVKEIYAKTRVNRMPDLVRLVLSLAHSAV